jgi:hypothetical protein
VLALSVRRCLGVLLVVGLPLALMICIAALDVLDIFRLRRWWCALLVFGAGAPWGLGHMLGSLLAFLAWSIALAVSVAFAVLGLRLLPVAARERWETARPSIKLGLMLLAIFGLAYPMALMANYTVAMLAFTAVWLVPGIGLLRAAGRTLRAPPRAWMLAGGTVLAVWVALLSGVVLGLERLSLTAERVIPVPAASARHVFMRLGFLSQAGARPQALTFSPAGDAVLVRLEGQTMLAFDVASGHRLARVPALPFPDPGSATSPGGAARIELLAERGEARLSGDGGGWTFPVHRPQKALALALSRDGHLLATAGTDNAVRLWAVPSGRHLGTLLGHSNDVTAVAFAPDGRRLATGSADGTLRLWRVP